MRVFVTGADGFLGSNLLRELKSRGHEVVAFLQKSRSHEHIEEFIDEKQFGDLLDPKSLIDSTKNCDAVIHTAANTDIWPPRKEIVRRVNIEGSKNVVRAVQENGIKRLVYVGTANSFGPGTKESPGDESRPYAAAKYGLDYMDSKYEVHQFVEAEAKAGRLPAIIVNPTFMMGEHDSKPGPGEMLIGIYHQKAPGYSPGGRNVVHVKDACVAIANALEMGADWRELHFGWREYGLQRIVWIDGGNRWFKSAYQSDSRMGNRPFWNCSLWLVKDLWLSSECKSRDGTHLVRHKLFHVKKGSGRTKDASNICKDRY